MDADRVTILPLGTGTRLKSFGGFNVVRAGGPGVVRGIAI